MDQKLLIRALRGEATGTVPFWLMRQAGRYLPEYRALREKAGSFLNLCFTPEKAAEATLQPIKRFGMDGAILFSDILVVPHALGQEVRFETGEGPRLAPYKKIEGVDPGAFLAALAPVYEAVRCVKKDLPKETALIGFAGAPWTLACYMICGRGGDFSAAIRFAKEQPEEMAALTDVLVEAVALHLGAQIEAGAEAVQIFDSWAASAPDFARWVVAPTRKIVARVRAAHPTAPIIGFPRGAGEGYKTYARETGVSCVGIDQGYSLKGFSTAVQNKSARVAVQGNLDPALLLAGGAEMAAGVRRVLEEAGDAPFVFNLGHGVIKETPPDNVAQLARLVREWHR